MGEAATVVRRVYEVLNRGESAAEVVAKLEPILHPEAEYVNPSDALEPGVRRGRDGWRAAIEGIMDGLGPGATWGIDELVERTDRVLVTLSLRTGGTMSGVEVAGPTIAAVWTVRDGLICRLEWCWDPNVARASFDAG